MFMNKYIFGLNAFELLFINVGVFIISFFIMLLFIYFHANKLINIKLSNGGLFFSSTCYFLSILFAFFCFIYFLI